MTQTTNPQNQAQYPRRVKVLTSGLQQVTVTIPPNAEVFVVGPKDTMTVHPAGTTAVVINPDAYYSLGEPLHEDVLNGHILADAHEVRWDSLEQKFIR